MGRRYDCSRPTLSEPLHFAREESRYAGYAATGYEPVTHVPGCSPYEMEVVSQPSQAQAYGNSQRQVDSHENYR